MHSTSRLLALILLIPMATRAAIEPAGFQPAELAIPPSCQSSLSTALAEAPEPLLMSGCSAQQECQFGPDVSCTGTYSCTVHSASVTCDNVTTSCFHCWPPVDCNDPLLYCECRASGGSHLSCSGQYCF